MTVTKKPQSAEERIRAAIANADPGILPAIYDTLNETLPDELIAQLPLDDQPIFSQLKTFTKTRGQVAGTIAQVTDPTVPPSQELDAQSAMNRQRQRMNLPPVYTPLEPLGPPPAPPAPVAPGFLGHLAAGAERAGQALSTEYQSLGNMANVPFSDVPPQAIPGAAPVQDTTIPEKIGSWLGENVVGLAPSLVGGAAGFALGGPPGAVIGYSVPSMLQTLGGVYNDALSKGADHDTAISAATKSAAWDTLVNGVAGALGIKVAGAAATQVIDQYYPTLLRKLRDQVIYQGLIQGTAGGVTTGGQNVVAQQTYEPERPTLQNVPQVAAGRGLLTALPAAIGLRAGKYVEVLPPEVSGPPGAPPPGPRMRPRGPEPTGPPLPQDLNVPPKGPAPKGLPEPSGPVPAPPLEQPLQQGKNLSDLIGKEPPPGAIPWEKGGELPKIAQAPKAEAPTIQSWQEPFEVVKQRIIRAGAPVDEATLREWHVGKIGEALKSGQSIPPEVQRGYPELFGEVPEAPAPPIERPAEPTLVAPEPVKTPESIVERPAPVQERPAPIEELPPVQPAPVATIPKAEPAMEAPAAERVPRAVSTEAGEKGVAPVPAGAAPEMPPLAALPPEIRKDAEEMQRRGIDQSVIAEVVQDMLAEQKQPEPAEPIMAEIDRVTEQLGLVEKMPVGPERTKALEVLDKRLAEVGARAGLETTETEKPGPKPPTTGTGIIQPEEEIYEPTTRADETRTEPLRQVTGMEYWRGEIAKGNKVPDLVLRAYPELSKKRVSPIMQKPAVAAVEPEREYSSTQINLPQKDVEEIRNWGKVIPDDELAADGREQNPHITVKYGIHSTDPEAVRKVVEAEPPITFTYGKTSIFKAEEGQPHDVVKVDVQSPDLQRINVKIAAATDVTDTHPTYQPHATIAYVKPGMGKKYAGDSGLEGKTATINEIVFSAKDGKEVTIPLLGKAVEPEIAAPEVPQGPVTPEDIEAAQRQWWNQHLTTAERSDILKGAGLGQFSPKTRWENLGPKSRALVDNRRPGQFRPEDKAPLSTPRTAEAAATEAAKPELSTPEPLKQYNATKKLANLLRVGPGQRVTAEDIPNFEEFQQALQAPEGQKVEPDAWAKDVMTRLLREKARARLASGGEAIPAVPSPVPEKTRHEIGKNAEGHTLFEDARGVRSYTVDGIRRTEPVRLTPTAAGVKNVVVRDPNSKEWNVVEPTPKAEKAIPSGQDFLIRGNTPGKETHLFFKMGDGMFDLQTGETFDSAQVTGAAFMSDALIREGDKEGMQDWINKMGHGDYDYGQIKAMPPAVVEANPPVTEEKPVTTEAPGATIEPEAPKEVPSAKTEEVPEREAGPPRRAAGAKPVLRKPDETSAGVLPEPIPEPAAGGEVAVPAEAPGEPGVPGRGEIDGPGMETGPGAGEGHGRPDRGPAGEPRTRPPKPAEDGTRRERPKTLQQRIAERRADLPDGQRNYLIAADQSLVPSGAVSKYNANIAAIRLLKKLESEKRYPTQAEKETLSQYSGWGDTQLAPYFDRVKWDRIKDYDERQARWPSGYYSSSGYLDDQTKAWREKYYERAKALHELLTDDEFNAAARSTQNAHYTSSEVIQEGLWAIARRLGFKGGQALENSAGIGHVIGLIPSEFEDKTQWTAAELDRVSSGILKLLYPEINLHRGGFQDAPIENATMDLVIGNPPFAKDGPVDKAYPRFSLHNYMLARSIDKTKPGGLLIQITSTSTMDNAASAEFREWASKRVDLVGAIRLPNNAFKKNAGTEVTTDILVFRKKDQRIFKDAQPWIETRPHPVERPKEATPEEVIPSTVNINRYFVDHPEQMIGRMSLEDSMYRKYEPALVEEEGQDSKAKLRDAVARLPKGIALFDPLAAPILEGPQQEAGAGAKDFSYQIKDGKVYQVKSGKLVPPEWPQKRENIAQVKSLIDLRDKYLHLVDAQLSPGASDAEIETQRKALKVAYDSFFKSYGNIHDNSSYRLFHEDPGYQPLRSLEYEEVKYADKPTGKAGKVKRTRIVKYLESDILTKRTQFPPQPPTKADNPEDAIAISESWRGNLDAEYVAKLLGLEDAAAAESHLIESGHAFRDPMTRSVMARNEYLSGNLRKKLDQAEEAVKLDSAYQSNIEALKSALPADKPVSKISIRLGATWVPTEIYDAWFDELFAEPNSGKTFYSEDIGHVVVRWRDYVIGSQKNRTTLSAGGEFGTDLINHSMAMTQPRITHTERDGDTTRTVYDHKETEAARAKQKELQEIFESWAKQSKYADQLARLYNDKFNGNIKKVFAPPVFDRFPGMSESYFKPRSHQVEGTMRGIRESFVLGDEVGTGKTMVFINLAMEWKRLGLAKKVLIGALNANVNQIAETFKRMYPQAKVLFPTPDDFEKDNRQRLMSRIASGDWDAVILAHSQFNMIQDDSERVKAWIQTQIDKLVQSVTDREESEFEIRKVGRSGKRGRTKDPAVKAMERAIQKLEQRLDDLTHRPIDSNLTFEQLGVDGLILDEAHQYKKVYFDTMLPQMKGLDTDFSLRGMSLLMKVRHVQEKTGGRNVILATGTPVTNTLAESWNIMRVVRPDLMKEWGIPNFDDFASTFASAEARVEQDAVGRWRETSRFAYFKNQFQLSRMWSQVGRQLRADDVGIERPKLAGGKPKIIEIEPGPALQAINRDLLRTYEWFEGLSGKERMENSHVPLVIMGLARKASLDVRLYDASLPQDTNTKAESVADEAFKLWKEFEADRATQTIFSDLFQNTNPATKKVDFNLFEEIRDKLIERGIPEDQIAILTDDRKYATSTAKGRANREEFQEEFNAGNIRIAMGTTARLGTGLNIQERMIAQHQLDATQTPAGDEQRVGRLVRQGNIFTSADLNQAGRDSVMLIRYGMARTFDSGSYQMLARKQKTNHDFLGGEPEEDTVEDVQDETAMTYEQAAAAFSGNPLTRKRFELKKEVQRLEAVRDVHYDQMTAARNRLRSEQGAKEYLEKRLQATNEFIELHAKTFEDPHPPFSLPKRIIVSLKELDTLPQVEFPDVKTAAAHLDKLIEAAEKRLRERGLEEAKKPVLEQRMFLSITLGNGKLGSIPVQFAMSGYTTEDYQKLDEERGMKVVWVAIGQNVEGSGISSDSVLRSLQNNMRPAMSRQIPDTERAITENEKGQVELRAAATKKFPYADQLQKAKTDLVEVEGKLTAVPEGGEKAEKVTSLPVSMERRFNRVKDEIDEGVSVEGPAATEGEKEEVQARGGAFAEYAPGEAELPALKKDQRWRTGEYEGEAWFTNGKFAVQGAAPEGAASGANIEWLMSTFDAVSTKQIAPERFTTWGFGKKAKRLIVFDNGLRLYANQFDYMNSLHPGAEYFVEADKKEPPILWKVEGKTVALVMPISPDAEEPKSGEAGFLLFGPPKRPTPTLGMSDDAEVRKQVEASRGTKGKPAMEKIRDMAESIYDEFTEHYPALAGDEFGAEKNILLRIEAIPEYSRYRAAHDIKNILGPIAKDDNKRNLFEAIIIWRDLVKDIGTTTNPGILWGKELPFGYTSQAQVEHDMAKFEAELASHSDVQAAISRRQKIMRELAERAVDRKLLKPVVLKDDRYYHHQVLEYMAVDKLGMPEQSLGLARSGWQLARKGSNKNFNTEYLQSEFSVMSDMHRKIELKDLMEELRETADISERVKAKAKKQGLDNWKEAIPEGYVIWQPEKGNYLYKVYTLTEEVLDSLLASSPVYVAGKPFEELMEEIYNPTAIALGKKKPEWVIRKELAKALKDFQEHPQEQAVSRATRYMNGRWKQSALFFPERALKYNFNNLTGDVDIAWAYNPKIITAYAYRALKDLLAEKKGKLTSRSTINEIDQARKHGIFQAHQTIQEIPDMVESVFMKRLLGQPVGPVAGYFDWVYGWSNFRESVLRLAAYRFFKDALARGEKRYAASDRAEIDAITDPDQRAARLASDLMGNYGNVSRGGMYLRNHVVPFYSWMEINSPRYYRMFRNAGKEEGPPAGGGGGGASPPAGPAGAATPPPGPGPSFGRLAGAKAATTTLRLAARALAYYALVQIWNNTFFPDEEKELGQERRQLHLILGRNEDGTVFSLRIQGAFSDFLSWFAAEDFPADFMDVVSGKVPWSQQLNRMIKGPVEKFVQGLTPLVKTPMEVFTGKSTYPEAIRAGREFGQFRPGGRPIRDIYEQIARTVSSTIPFRHLAGKPSEGFLKELARTFIYQTDIGEAAMFESDDMERRFLEKKKAEPPQVPPKERANALYYWKQSIRYDDEKAASKYWKQYTESGGDVGTLHMSIRKTRPLADMPLRYRKEFMDSLTGEEKQTVERAEKYWEVAYQKQLKAAEAMGVK